jgi:hypothetical protein
MEVNMEHGRIFISYSRANSNFVVRLAKDLKAAGHNIWLDQLDIPPGARWDAELERALEKCEIFMLILTPASMASENVKDEIGYAIDTQKRIVPVLLESASLPLRLRRFQYVDFTSKSYEDGLESAERLLRNLSEAPSSPRIEISTSSQANLKVPEKNRSFVAQPAKMQADRRAKEKPEPAMPARRKQAALIALPIGIGLTILVAIGVLFFLKLNFFASAAAVQNPTQVPTKVSTIALTKTPIIFAQWMDVPLSDLGFVSDDDIGARFRATQEYSQRIGYIAGFPNFYFNNTTQSYGTVLLKEDAVVWRDVPINELGNTPQSDVPQLFRSVHDYATSHGFVGGFPDFFTDDAQKVYGVNFISQGAGEWRDVPIEDLGNPSLDDVPAMFMAVDKYAAEHGFVSGYPNFYVDDVRKVYGVILIKSAP